MRLPDGIAGAGRCPGAGLSGGKAGDRMFLFRRTDINEAVNECTGTPGAVLLDVREPEEFRSGHIPGAVNIPLSKIRGIGIPKDTPLFVYCLRGTRSLRAARILTRMGYGKARSIGGIIAYRGKTEQ